MKYSVFTVAMPEYEVNEIPAKLKEWGYDGWISIEDFSTVNPLDERLMDDLKFLKALEKKAVAS